MPGLKLCPPSGTCTSSIGICARMRREVKNLTFKITKKNLVILKVFFKNYIGFKMTQKFCDFLKTQIKIFSKLCELMKSASFLQKTKKSELKWQVPWREVFKFHGVCDFQDPNQLKFHGVCDLKNSIFGVNRTFGPSRSCGQNWTYRLNQKWSYVFKIIIDVF